MDIWVLEGGRYGSSGCITTSFYVFYLGVFPWKMEEWQANDAENDELEALNREYEEIRQQEE
jgi:hypothetical protein